MHLATTGTSAASLCAIQAYHALAREVGDPPISHNTQLVSSADPFPSTRHLSRSRKNLKRSIISAGGFSSDIAVRLRRRGVMPKTLPGTRTANGRFRRKQ